jgi:hypothetical protein
LSFSSQPHARFQIFSNTRVAELICKYRAVLFYSDCVWFLPVRSASNESVRH